MPLTENFDDYNVGDLNGQGGWSGSTAFDVQTSTKYSGSSAIYKIGDGGTGLNCAKSFTGSATGSQIWHMRTESHNGGYSVYVIFFQSSTPLAYFYFYEGYLRLFVPGNDETVILSDSIGTWYKCELEWNATTDGLRGRVNDGDWTGWFTCSNAFTEVDTLMLSGKGTGYWDNFYEGVTFTPVPGPFPLFFKE